MRKYSPESLGVLAVELGKASIELESIGNLDLTRKLKEAHDNILQILDKESRSDDSHSQDLDVLVTVYYAHSLLLMVAEMFPGGDGDGPKGVVW